MPHKHVRKRDGSNAHFDLPPNKKAKPLPTFQAESKLWKKKGKKDVGPSPKLKRKRTETSDYKEDDTPRAFARMMQIQATGKRPSGLDDEKTRQSKKAKTEASMAPVKKAAPEATRELPKIMPGERLADYNARVDQALPMGDVVKKGKKVAEIKERQTKTEKRLKKMYAEWRQEDAKIKENLEEFQEQQEEADEELEEKYGVGALKFAESRRAKRKRIIGETEAEEDPWEVLKLKRDAPKGLHDVVEAPPNLTAVPKEKFKVRNGAKVFVANVPTASGSLKRREELSDARKEVIERYRAMMKGR